MGTVNSDGGTKTVGAGVEYPAGSFSGYPPVSIDLTGTQIIVTLNTAASFSPASFNGFHITFLSGSITVATADASSTFNPFAITIIGNDLFLNYQSVAVSASGSSIINVTGTGGSAVPEPASLILLGSALAGLALSRLRKTAA